LKMPALVALVASVFVTVGSCMSTFVEGVAR
jgi:hypothetical protein